MSETSPDGLRPVVQVPQSLWALGWTSVAGQVLGLAEQGPQEQIFLLRAYRASAWFAWQRTRPVLGPSIVPILLVAVLVGALGGVVGAPSNGPRFDVNVSV